MSLLKNDIDPKKISSLDLAFIGDCVYEIMVRENLLKDGSKHVGKLHKLSVSYVSAKAQTEAYRKIENILSQEEMEVFKRGRNAKVGHYPKSASVSEYHTATGIESLFGYLYLDGKEDRIKDLFDVIISE